MAFELPDDFARRQLHDLDEFVRRARGEVFSVRRKVETEHGVAVYVGKGLHQFTRGYLPEFDFAAARRRAAAGPQ